MKTATKTKVEIGFHHCSGGDSLLPACDRGFFDGYTVRVEATTPAEAERLGIAAMQKHVAAHHVDWPTRAIDDLGAEVWMPDAEFLLDFDDDTWNQPFRAEQMNPAAHQT